MKTEAIQVLIFGSHGPVEYSATEHLCYVFKWLYWSADQSPSGQSLLACCGVGIDQHTKLHMEVAQHFGKKVAIPIAAGGLMRGNETSWDSMGFGVVTPENMKPSIRAALGLVEM